MKRISVPLSALIIFCIFFFSCQKDAVENNLQALNNKSSLEELKSYYQSEVVSSLRGSKGPKVTGPTTDSPEWEKALFSAEKNTYIIPVRINASKANEDILVSKYLVFTEANSKKNGFFYYAFADMKTNKPISPQQVLSSLHSSDDGNREIKKTGYTFVKASLQQDELLLKAKDKSTGRSGKYIAQKKASETQQPGGTDVSGFAPILGCEASGGTLVTIDWYYQVFVNGQLVSETYVYSTSQCMGGSGGGGTGGGSGGSSDAGCASTLNTLANSATISSDLISTTTLTEGPLLRTKQYEWRILKNSGWSIYSFEKGTHYKDVSTGTWKWQSLEHLNIALVGAVPGLNIEPSVVNTLSEIGAYTSVMGIELNVKYSIDCSGFPASLTLSYLSRKAFSITNTVTPEP